MAKCERCTRYQQALLAYLESDLRYWKAKLKYKDNPHLNYETSKEEYYKKKINDVKDAIKRINQQIEMEG